MDQTKHTTEVIEFDNTPLTKPAPGIFFSALSFLGFFGLLIWLALHAPWPLWVRILLALPFLALFLTGGQRQLFLNTGDN